MSGWLVPRHELTPEQLRAVELSPNQHRVFTGGPGSGKTLVLLHRARHLADAKNVPPEKSMEAFAILRTVSWHVTVVLDRKQGIYEGGAVEAQILSALGIRSRSVAFLEAYRCSPYVAGLAKRFVDDAAEREEFGGQARSEKPLLFRATCKEEELARLAGVARERVARGEGVAVLVPARRLIGPIAEGLAAEGIPVEVPANRNRSGPPTRLPLLDFTSDFVKVMPYHSAKGLTFDTVLLPRLVEPEFRRVGPENLLRLLFVGITRARTWVYLSTCAGKEHRVLERAGLLDGGADLVVQEGDPMWAFGTSTPADNARPEGPGRDGSMTSWL